MCRGPANDLPVKMQKNRSMASKNSLQKIFIVTFMIGCAAIEANSDISSAYRVTSPAPGSLMYASSTSHDLIDEDFLRSSSNSGPQARRKLIGHAKGKFTGIGRPQALLPPGQKRRRRIFNMMKHKLSKHEASAAYALARQHIQKLVQMQSPDTSLTVDTSKSVMLNNSMHVSDKFKATTRKPITKSPPVYKPGPAIIKFAPDKGDFIKAGLLENTTNNAEKMLSKKKMDKFMTTYRPNFVFKKLHKMPKKLQNMEGMSLYVETAYSPVYTNHPLATKQKHMRNEEVRFRKYNVSAKHKSHNGRNVHGTTSYYKQIDDRNDLYPAYRTSLSPTASSYIPPVRMIPPKSMIHPLPHVALPSPNTYKLNNMNHRHIQMHHHHIQTPSLLPVHQPVMLHNVHPTHHRYKPPQNVPHVYYSQPSRGYHLSKDPYQLNSYHPVPRSSFEVIPTHYGYSAPFQPSSHKPVYKKLKNYTVNNNKPIPKFSISFPDEHKSSHLSNVYSNISLSSKVGNKLISPMRPLYKPKIIRASNIYDVQPETTTISSKNYRISDTRTNNIYQVQPETTTISSKNYRLSDTRENNIYQVQPETTTISSKNYRISDQRTKTPVIRDLTTSSPLEYIMPKYNNGITSKQPTFLQSSTPYPYSVSLKELKHYKISKNKELKRRRIPGVPGEALKDYPIHNGIPKTPFSCVGKVTGYYSDLDAQCQVFHRCQFRGHKSSFLCPNGTLFNQRLLTCDHWRNVDCENSYKHYEVNRKIFKTKRMTNYNKKLKDFVISISNHEDIDDENNIYGSSENPADLKVKYSFSKKLSHSTSQPSFQIETKSSTVSKSTGVKAEALLTTTMNNHDDGIYTKVDNIGVPAAHQHVIQSPNSSQVTTRKPSPQKLDTAHFTKAQDQPSKSDIMKYTPVIRTTQPHIINPVKVYPYLP